MDLKQDIPFIIPVDKIIIAPNLGAQFAAYIANYQNLVLVCDENTSKCINFPLDEKIKKITFPKDIHASLENADKIPPGADLYIAVGAGTINDLVKYAAHKAGKPYVSYATAASMNGYASGTASLLDGGYKKSYNAKPPKAIFMDLNIISAAPPRLAKAGIADSYCRMLCENDNILAHHATGVEYHHSLFRLMERYEDKIFSDITALCKTLIFGGVAMYVAGSSAPASGAEHIIAHYMELMKPEAEHNLHGEKIAVCSIVVAGLQQQIIRNKNFQFRHCDEELLRSHFTKTGQVEYFLNEARRKFTRLDGRRIENAKFVMPYAENYIEKFQSLGLPTKPEQLGWDPQTFRSALDVAAYTRNRVTFLDLSY